MLSRSNRTLFFGLLLGLSLSASLALRPARAQYFGRNKVQYRDFNFRILKTEHFDIYFYDEERPVAEKAGQMAERWYSRYARVLDHQLRGRQPLVLYASHPQFEQTNAILGDLSEGTGGVTDILKRRIVLPVAGPLAETNHVIGHELVHAFQFDMTGQGKTVSAAAVPGAAKLPLWFIEGMAEYYSIGPVDPNTAMWMRDAIHENDLPSIHKLGSGKYFPYRYGQAFWGYVAGRYGDEAVGKLLRAAGRSGDVERAIRQVLGIGVDTLSEDWHAALRKEYQRIIPGTRPASIFASALATEAVGGGRLNVSPALSPDGSRMMYLSERDVYSIELYLADARTGRVVRRITRTLVDPHLQSLQFIGSAGAWSPDGNHFAFAAVSHGQPVLTVIDVNTGETSEEVPFPKEYGEVFNPSYSPTGDRVVVSALLGGATDLAIVDLKTRDVHRITHDLFGEFEPAWSPDGKSIAFVTDRFSSDPGTLEFGNYRLALADVQTDSVREVPGFADGKNINPQWSPDGQGLYFVSDHGGISNVYRVALADGRISQLTQVLTGISGITNLSPAISVARGSGQMAFSAYEKGDFNLYRVDHPDSLETPPVVDSAAPLSPADLSAGLRKLGPGGWLEFPDSLLIDPGRFRVENYRPGLSLDYVDQPTVGIGVSSQGLAAAGGAGMYFSDMLGDHQLNTVLQLDTQGGGNFQDNFGFEAEYDNLHSRVHWGGIVGEIPYVTRGYSVDQGTLNGEYVERDQTYTYSEIDRELLGVFTYPFSPVQRLEFTGGLRRVDFSSTVRTQYYDLVTGDLVGDETASLPADTLTGLNLLTAGTALVYDNSVFGGTSPLLGHRYRLDFSQIVGTLSYTGILTDIRQYQPVSRGLTLAGRFLQYGRYGPDSDDPRLSTLFLGYSYLVRGYNDGSFDLTDTTNTFGRLFGSRLAIANLEARVPLLGPVGVVRSNMIPPLETFLFYDAGVAWSRGEKPSLFGGDQHPVTSYGAGLRLNLLGFAVAELDYVHPNDRPQKGWYWELSLQPGF